MICPVDMSEVKIPAMTTLGGVFCDLYNLVRYSWRASRDWGLIIRYKVYARLARTVRCVRMLDLNFILGGNFTRGLKVWA